MEANSKVKDEGSAESPTSVLEEEVCLVLTFFFPRSVWFSGLRGKVKERKVKREERKRKKSLENDSFDYILYLCLVYEKQMELYCYLRVGWECGVFFCQIR